MTATEVDQLLANGRWVERLARSLIADPHAAADLAQDAWLSALTHTRGEGRPVRRWLAAILRNLARDRARAERRAAQHVASLAKGDGAGPQQEGVLERLEQQERLAAAVRALAEPYRTAVVLRYLEGLSPRAIAERTGAPVRTVHTRLQRALAALRAHFDREYRGDRRAWVLALLPLARPAAFSLLGVTAVKLKSILLAAAAALALAGVWHFALEPETAGPQQTAHGEPAALSDAGAKTPAHDATVPQEPAAPARTELAAPTTAPPRGQVIHGVVTDAHGTPLPGLRVHFSGLNAPAERPAAVSDAHGAFTLPAPLEIGTLDVDDPAFVTLLRPQVWADGKDHEYVLVVAPRVELGGEVVDESGAPIADATVRVSTWALRYALPHVVSRSVEVEHKTTTDAKGRFTLRDAAVFPGGRLATLHPDFRPAIDELPARARLDLRIVLARETDTGPKLRGRVVDAHGAAVADAWVAAGEMAAKSDAVGAFAIDTARDGAPIGRTLRAVKSGWLPAEVECAGGDPRDPSAWPQPLVVVLARQALTLSGRVVDAQGRPVPGARVLRVERTAFATIEDGEGESRWSMRADLEHLAGGGGSVGCGEDGTFRLGGLLERSYTLRAVDPRTLAFVYAGPFVAGTADVEVRLPAERLIARLAGHVVERSGEPVAGASVSLRRVLPASPDGGGAEQAQTGASVTTAADGSFEFRNVAAAVSSLAVQRDWLQHPLAVDLASFHDLANVRIALPSVTHLKVDLADSEVRATAFAVLDSAGAELSFLFPMSGLPSVFPQGEGSYSIGRMPLVDGRSQALQVPDSAQAVVLFDGAREVRRIALRLRAGELNVARP